MNMNPLKSSHISEVGYDPETQELHVKFSTGHTYSYPGVSQEQHDALVAAESPGKHFREKFRGVVEGKRL